MLVDESGFLGFEPCHELLEGDSMQVLDTINNDSCRLVITSPPYNIGKEYERDRRRSYKNT